MNLQDVLTRIEGQCYQLLLTIKSIPHFSFLATWQSRNDRISLSLFLNMFRSIDVKSDYRQTEHSQWFLQLELLAPYLGRYEIYMLCVVTWQTPPFFGGEYMYKGIN